MQTLTWQRLVGKSLHTFGGVQRTLVMEKKMEATLQGLGFRVGMKE